MARKQLGTCATNLNPSIMSNPTAAPEVNSTSGVFFVLRRSPCSPAWRVCRRWRNEAAAEASLEKSPLRCVFADFLRKQKVKPPAGIPGGRRCRVGGAGRRGRRPLRRFGVGTDYVILSEAKDPYPPGRWTEFACGKSHSSRMPGGQWPPLRAVRHRDARGVEDAAPYGGTASGCGAGNPPQIGGTAADCR